MNFRKKNVDLGCRICYLNDSIFKSLHTKCSAGVSFGHLKEEVRKRENYEDKKTEMINKKEDLKRLKSFYENLIEKIDNQEINFNGSEYNNKDISIASTEYIKERHESDFEHKSKNNFTIRKNIKDLRKIIRVKVNMQEREDDAWSYRNYYYSIRINSEAEEKKIVSKIVDRIKEIEDSLENMNLDSVENNIAYVQKIINVVIPKHQKAECKRHKREEIE